MRVAAMEAVGCEPGGCGHYEGQFDAGLAGRKRHTSVIRNTLLYCAGACYGFDNRLGCLLAYGLIAADKDGR